MRQLIFGVLVMAVLCAMFVSPAVAQQPERGAELNIFFGRTSASSRGVSFPASKGFGVDFEYPAIENYLTTGIGFRHESAGTINMDGFNVRVSRTYIGSAFRIYPLKQEKRFRPYGLFNMGYGRNKFTVDDQSQSQNAMIPSVGGGAKFDLTKRWAIGTEATLSFGGSQRDPYTGQKYGTGVRSKALWLNLIYRF